MNLRPGESIELWPPDSIPAWDAAIASDRPCVTAYPVEGSRGTVLVCPGGGYNRRVDYEKEPIARWLNQLGLSAFTLDYRVAPYRFPVPGIDARRALRLLRTLVAGPVGVLGFSAGGHLAGTVAVVHDPGDPAAADPIERESSRPDFAVLCYPVVSFLRYPHPGSLLCLLGEGSPVELRRRASVEENVTPQAPPMFLWHAADDQLVAVENSLALARALAAASVPFELHVFARGGHGLLSTDLVPETARWRDLCAAWLLGQVG